MTSSSAVRTHGSRTAAYLVSWLVATVPAWCVAATVVAQVPGLERFDGLLVATAIVAALWVAGIAWLVAKRRQDRFWDRSLPRKSR